MSAPLNCLHAYYWDSFHKKIACKSNRGPKSYCFKPRLLTLDGEHQNGKDVIEKQFFREIDDKGAKVHAVLVNNGADQLTGEQRCEFAHLLLSLDMRRPENVTTLKEKGAKTLIEGLDSDGSILEQMSLFGLTGLPSEYYIKTTGIPPSDTALLVIQNCINNPDIGGKLINAHWRVVDISSGAPSLILSDRPLVRLEAYDSRKAIWILPLTPKKLFIATNSKPNLNISLSQLAKKANIISASQADKYVFSIDAAHAKWLGKYLRR
jgi:hypothetical protein